jgi:methanethiol S-methyltransferase
MKMQRIAVLAYGIVAYLAFLAVFLYLAGFLSGMAVPKTIDSGEPGPLGTAVLVNTLLVGLFGLQHAVMARPWFKAHWTKIVPEPIERSTFVLAASAVLALMFWQWRPLPEVLWQAESAWLRLALLGLFASGAGIVLYTSFLTNHFELFGLRQVWLYFRGRPYTPLSFTTRSMYRYVRHPMMIGMLLIAWMTPVMTVGHLLFAVLITAYVFAGTRLEERTLVQVLGDDYRRYQASTPMLIPLPRAGAARSATPAAQSEAL